MTGAAASADGPLILHATCVAAHGRGLLILGPSGAGKSALALQMIAMGARLVADDRTEVTATAQGLVARCPSALAGLIEARGIGILHADPLDQAPLALVADLGQQEADRLPPRRTITILGQGLPLVLGRRDNHFPAALMVYLQGGRQD